MIIEVDVQKCKVTASGGVELDTISNIIHEKINTEEIVVITDIKLPKFINKVLLIMTNNNGFIIESGVI
jgi:hypothetical protein